MKKLNWIYGILVLMMSACGGTDKQQIFKLLPASETGITFNNQITENDSINILKFTNMYNGGGVAAADLNNDGLQDLIFAGNMVPSRLYLNKGDLQFEDVTENAGLLTSKWVTGVSLVDINGDGLLDVYFCVSGSESDSNRGNLFYINDGIDANGMPSFTEVAKQAGVDHHGYSTQAAFFDYDKDGDLDLYVLTNAMEDFAHNTRREKKMDGSGASNDQFFRNDGPDANGYPIFTDVTREAGIQIEGYGLGINIVDINQDGWPDIYAGNDFITNDLLWVNNQDGTFTNKIAKYIKHQTHNSMGIDVSDFNNDGLVDIMIVDMLPEHSRGQKLMMGDQNYDLYQYDAVFDYQHQHVRNTLQLNNGENPEGDISFSEIGMLAEVYKTEWSWSVLFGDYDNDGWRDMMITNGYPRNIIDLDYIFYSSSQAQFGTKDVITEKTKKLIESLEGIKVQNYLYRNNRDLTFEKVSEKWGFNTNSYSSGAVHADFDNDGDLDLAISNINDEAFFYENRSNELVEGSKGNYLQLKLKGEGMNTQGLGAKIWLHTENGTQYYEHTPYRGFQSTMNDVLHFGLGTDQTVKKLEILWPYGGYQALENVQAGQVLTLLEKEAKGTSPPPQPKPSPLFREVTEAHQIAFAHKEQYYIDFKTSPLLPHMHSKSGPGIAVGDLNGDGLDDFYIGGAGEQPSACFVQQADGNFQKMPFTFAADSLKEDMGALLFDADNDGDNDLYVVSGGSERTVDGPHFADRFYRNDGQGNFTYDPTALPEIQESGSCVKAADFDQDGDLDLFVGGRIQPKTYPEPTKSYLLRNDGGKFTDITDQAAPGLREVGLVTDALWTDYDNDEQIDLVITGEWMPLTIFRNVGGQFSEVTEQAGLGKTNGWWNSLVAADFDHDGDMDYAAGNLGLNTKYKVSEEQPMTVYAKDYDKSGSIDPIMFYYIAGEKAPAHPRDALINQIQGMRRRFYAYKDYAEAEPDQIISPQEREGAFEVNAYHMQTSYFENQGDGTFKVKTLPIRAQFSPVFGMVAKDFNSDGHDDLLMVGNSYATETLTGKYDAFIGLLLAGDGKGGFEAVPMRESGFYHDGDAKSFAEVFTPQTGPLYLVGNNDGQLKAYKAEKEVEGQALRLQPQDAWAEVTLQDGTQYKQEFFYGSTYLSQSSRVFTVPENAQKVEIFDFKGQGRVAIPSVGK